MNVGRVEHVTFSSGPRVLAVTPPRTVQSSAWCAQGSVQLRLASLSRERRPHLRQPAGPGNQRARFCTLPKPPRFLSLGWVKPACLSSVGRVKPAVFWWSVGVGNLLPRGPMRVQAGSIDSPSALDESRGWYPSLYLPHRKAVKGHRPAPAPPGVFL